jgi:hypothetical protein
LLLVIDGILYALPSTTAAVPDEQHVVSRRCNTRGLNVLRVVLQDSIGDHLPEHGVKYVRMGGFRTSNTVIIIYHYLVDLVVTISSTVVTYYVIGTIRVDFPLRDELNEVFKGY